MNKLWKLAAVASAAIVGPIYAAMPASAATDPKPPLQYGFDGTPHVIVGGGSDTTYKVVQNLADLYQSSAISGCAHATSNATGPDLNKCATSASRQTNSNLANWQGDTIGNANPTGSGAGVSSLNGFLTGGATTISYNGAVNPLPDTPCIDDTSNPLPNVDFARSSSSAKTSGGAITGCSGNELNGDTFWGFAEDAVAVTVFGTARNSQVNAAVSNHPVGKIPLSAEEVFRIYNCEYTHWGQVPSLDNVITDGGPDDGPIVPWSMNSSSGTYSTFNTWVTNNAGLGTFAANTKAGNYDASGNPVVGGSCVRKISNGTGFPLENDIKQIVNDPAVTLSASDSSGNNPKNWLWWGSNGVFTAFPFTSSVVKAGTPVTAFASPINGVVPSLSTNLDATGYAINRTLWHVTRKIDADCPFVAGKCDFTTPAATAKTGVLSGASGATATYTANAAPNNGAPVVGDFFQIGGVAPNRQVTAVTGSGPYTLTFDDATGVANGAAVQKQGPSITTAVNDINVKGPVGGTGGAVRELTRWICRVATTQYGLDPYTGINMGTEMGTAFNNAGFTVTPTTPASFRSPGSKCVVASSG